jgi:hypothetical protein
LLATLSKAPGRSLAAAANQTPPPSSLKNKTKNRNDGIFSVAIPGVAAVVGLGSAVYAIKEFLLGEPGN